MYFLSDWKEIFRGFYMYLMLYKQQELSFDRQILISNERMVTFLFFTV